MSDFDVQGARKAGYSDAEIADYLGSQGKFDVAGARQAGYGDADILSHLTSAPQRSMGEQGSRLAGQFAQGANDSIANTFGAPVDLVAAGLRKVGLPVSDPVGGSASLKRGIDYVATLPGRVSDAFSAGSFSPLTEDRTSRFEPENRAEKIASGVGEGVGQAVGTLVPAMGVARMATPGMTQSIAQTLAAQPAMQTAAGAVQGGVTGATDNPWLGLAAGVATPLAAAGVRGLVSPSTVNLAPQEQNLVRAADREGIPLTPAQRTGSPGLRMVEETMAKVPGSAGPMQRAAAEQRGQFNRAALERAGVTATDASPEVVDRAFTNLGQTFDDLANRTTLNVDRRFVQDIQNVDMNYGRRLPTDVARVFQSYMDDLAPALQAAQGGQSPQIAGDVYATIRSDIGKRIRSAVTNPDLQEALRGIQTALDGVAERSTSGPLQNEWREARRQYQALMTIDKAMQGGTQASRSAGDIPLAGLKQAVKQADPRGYARGRGQLNEISRVGDYIAQRTPDSGTPTRQAILNPLNWPMLAAGNLGARLYNTGPMQSYLTNQVAGTTNLPALYGGQGVRSALDLIPAGSADDQPRSLAAALMRANEKRQRAGR